MADTSLIIGNGNWAVKENSLLGYNIIQGKYVPIEMTVSRNTTATRVVNSAGLIELGPKNLFSYSQTFDNTSNWFPYPSPPLVPIVALIVIPNVLATSAPNGTFTADKLVAAATLSEHILIGTPPSAIVGTTYTVSVFAKAAELSRIQFLDNAGSGATANFNLATGAHSSSAATETMLPVGNDGWYRCTMTYAPTLAGTFNIHIKLAVGTGTVYNTSFLGNGSDGVYLWGAQLELGPTATEYFPTTDRFNIPRVDYSTGTASLLVEPARTNLILQSETFNNVYWTQTNVTVTANTTAAPNNTMTADTVLANGTTNTHSVRTDLISFTAGTSYSLSVFVKKGTNDFVQLFVGAGIGGMYANFNINTGVVGTVGTINGTAPTSSITNFGNGWYRCTMNFTAFLTDNTVGRFAIVASASAAREEINTLATSVILWGAQMEAGSNATSYIPTTTLIAGVTRNADVISQTGISSLIGQTEGTIFVEANLTANTDERRIITISNGTETQRIIFWTLSTTLYISINTAPSINLGNFPIGPAKIAFAYTITPGSPGSTTYSAKVNTDPLITGTLGVAPTPLTNINLGSSPGGSLFLNDRIKSVQLYKTALSL